MIAFYLGMIVGMMSGFLFLGFLGLLSAGKNEPLSVRTELPEREPWSQRTKYY